MAPEGGGTEQQPEVAEGLLPVGIRQRQRLFQVNLVVVGGPAVGLCRVQAPGLSISDNGPTGLSRIQQGDDSSSGVLIGSLTVALFILTIQAAPPPVSKTERQWSGCCLPRAGVKLVVRLYLVAMFACPGGLNCETHDGQYRFQQLRLYHRF